MESFHLIEHADLYGLDSVRWQVLLGVSSKLVLEAEVDVAKVVESGVKGPHHDATAGMFREKLKEGDRIKDVVQVRGDLEPFAEAAPLGAVCAVGNCLGAGGSNTRMLSVGSIGA
eukprot:1116240-Ditylum_brightwellii.AAC.1